jgi:hypothetical protein
VACPDFVVSPGDDHAGVRILGLRQRAWRSSVPAPEEADPAVRRHPPDTLFADRHLLVMQEQRTAAGENQPDAGRTPFGLVVREAMSCAASPFMERHYAVVRATREWEMARSSFYHQRALSYSFS